MVRYKGWNIDQYANGGLWYATWGYQLDFEAKTLGALKAKITNHLKKLNEED